MAEPEPDPVWAASYDPWSIIQDVDVPVRGIVGYSHVRVPWAAARTPEGVLKTGVVVAFLFCRSLMIADIQKRQAAEAAADPSMQSLTVPPAIVALMMADYDPPLVHFHCIGCDNTWDAWVDENGKLEDKRDVICSDLNCPRFGFPAQLADEDE